MKNIIYIAASLDGYIATKDGGLDWLMSVPNPENSDYGFNDFMNSIDAIIMGRNTFEKVLSFGQWIYTQKVFVLSQSLKGVPHHLEGKVEIVSGEIPKILSELNERGFLDLYIDGGQTIQSFLQLDLIDEMIVTRVSKLLGRGIPLFGLLQKTLTFEAINIELLSPSLVKTHYRRKRQQLEL